MAEKQGYKNILVLQGGLPDWEAKGYAIYAGPEYVENYASLLYTPKQVLELMKSKPGTFTLVDVREPDEFTEKHIPGAINIPVSAIPYRVTELDRNKLTILYCVSGGRSYNAIRKLRKLGFTKVGHVTLEDWEKEGFTLSGAKDDK